VEKWNTRIEIKTPEGHLPRSPAFLGKFDLKENSILFLLDHDLPAADLPNILPSDFAID
jgi:hypothetical protein